MTCHPFLTGRPGRVEALRRLIAYALEAGDVGFATAAQVADLARDDPDTISLPLVIPVADPLVYPLL